MGKKNNWELVENNKTRIRWGTGKKRNIIGHRGLHHQVWLTVVDNELFLSGRKSGNFNKEFNSKREAIDYAKKYMQSH